MIMLSLAYFAYFSIFLDAGQHTVEKLTPIFLLRIVGQFTVTLKNTSLIKKNKEKEFLLIEKKLELRLASHYTL